MKIERDARVMAPDGEVGHVTHVVVDRDTREVSEIVVRRGSEEFLIPASAIDNATGGTVHLRQPGSRLAGTQRFDRDAFHGVDDERAEIETEQRARHGGAPLAAADEDAVVIGDARQERPARPPAPRAADDQIVVPVAEERLGVAKRETELGAVLVRKRVVEEQQTVPVELMREEVRVEARDITDRPARPGDQLFQEGTIRVPVLGEEVIVEKEAVITGEVVLDKDQVVERELITDTVRRERVEVEEGTRHTQPAPARQPAVRQQLAPTPGTAGDVGARQAQPAAEVRTHQGQQTLADAGQVRESTQPRDTCARPAAPAPAPARGRASEGEIVVPVAEERVEVAKREAELGAVEIRKRVVEEQVSVPVELAHEEIHVQERDIADRPVRPGDEVFQGGTISVPVRGEEAVVEKEAVITGEVVLDKERVVEREQITDTVRREQIEVEERGRERRDTGRRPGSGR